MEIDGLLIGHVRELIRHFYATGDVWAIEDEIDNICARLNISRDTHDTRHPRVEKIRSSLLDWYNDMSKEVREFKETEIELEEFVEE